MDIEQAVMVGADIQRVGHAAARLRGVGGGQADLDAVKAQTPCSEHRVLDVIRHGKAELVHADVHLFRLLQSFFIRLWKATTAKMITP